MPIGEAGLLLCPPRRVRVVLEHKRKQPTYFCLPSDEEEDGDDGDVISDVDDGQNNGKDVDDGQWQK